MNEAQAVQAFLSGFGIPAYAASAVPADASYPYLTYGMVWGEWGAESETSVQVNIWYYGDSEAAPNAKVSEISQAVGYGGTLLRCDRGTIWVKRGTPFAQSVEGEGGDKVKRRYINLDLQFNIVG